MAACAAGTCGPAQRAQIAGLLAGRFPGADIHVAPDYVAAFLAAPQGTDACIVAGTGSVVCSRAFCGGVWASEIARSSFTSAMARASGRRVAVTRSLGDPVDGAVRLAGSIRP
ncbi:MAG TPA: hypothetical protein VFJ07_18850 [Streptosporangiaceae bacterium]|nr:hypothetical protein [Streptosporangiaceae bacterium]